jgi:hypothetical protein
MGWADTLSELLFAPLRDVKDGPVSKDGETTEGVDA